MSFHVSLRRAAAAMTAASLAAISTAMPTAAQAPVPNDSLQQLGACMAERGALDVVVLMDETGSLVGEFVDDRVDESLPGSDDEHNRIPAAQSFVDELVDRHADTGVDIRVRVSGFGQEYRSGATDPANYGEWQTLDESSADRVKGEIEDFRTRTAELYTNYANAMEGAYNDFARSGSANPCRMLVTFTDGELTAEEGAEVAEERICRPGGIADRLRAGGITNVGIGLASASKPSDFSLLRRITEADGGAPCGDQPANGTFFEASNVGALFGAFRQALSSGRDMVVSGPVGEPVEFALDNSIDAVRLNVIAEEHLGPNAHVVLTAPDGSTLDLGDSGRGELQGAAVEWVATHEPVQRVTGRMRMADGQDWSGRWQVGFAGVDDAHKDSQHISGIEIQPDLQVRFAGPDSEDAGALSLFDDQPLTIQLVDGAGNVRPMAGEARTTVTFTPDGQEPQVLADNADISSGSLEVEAPKLNGAPLSGRLESRTTVTTAGEPGTTFSPFINSQALSVSPQNLPQLAGPIQFNSDSVTGEGEVTVKGPGKVWVEPGTTLRADTLPDGVSAVSVASTYDSAANALEVPAGQTATLPVTFTVDEPTEGIINGAVDVTVADGDGAVEPATVPVSVNGSYTVPLNTAKFTGALLGTLLAALLIPLVIFYLIRYLTARIPTRRQLGAQRFQIDVDGAQARFVNGEPKLSTQEALRTPATLTPTSFTAFQYEGTVRGFHPNPFADAPVVLTQTPSLSEDGDQVKGAAKLPLALTNTWFVAPSSRGPQAYDVVALINPGTPEQQLSQMASEIRTRAPKLARQLHETRAAETTPTEGAAPGQKRGLGGRGRGGNDDANQQMPPTPPTPPTQQGGNYTSGGFGSGNQGGPGNTGGPGNQGGFGSGWGASGGNPHNQGGFGSGGWGSSGGSNPGGSNPGGYQPRPGGFGSN